MVDARYDEEIFPTDLLLSLATIAPERGVQPETLCRGLGFSSDDLRKPSTRVSYRQASLMIHRALEAIPDPALGLTLGGRATLGSMGVLGYAMAMSKTLGDAMSLGIKHLVSAGAVGYRIDVRAAGTLVWLELGHSFPDPKIQSFFTEESFASIFSYARALTGNVVQLTQIDFVHADCGNAELAQQMFGVPVKFGSASNRFVFDKSQLNLPVPTHHPLGLRQAVNLFEIYSVKERPQSDLYHAIERAAYGALMTGITLKIIADEIDIPSRSLRRRLAKGGISFDALIDNVRKTRALSLLTHSDVTVERVAVETGYSDVRNFRRAFKRWTGVSPNEYRN